MCLPRDEGGIITYCRLIARDVSSSKFFSVFLSLLRPSLLGNARLMRVEPVAKTKTYPYLTNSCMFWEGICFLDYGLWFVKTTFRFRIFHRLSREIGRLLKRNAWDSERKNEK